jgi:NadR type nicotinamide-nucleotide adenylyltransferase
METIARGGGVIRVVVTGSESTGKTTLAEFLANRFNAELVPEFVRSYAERKGGPIDLSDHGPIAYGQIALENDHIVRAANLIVQDTDLMSTVVYCNHYFGQCPPWIVETAAARRPDLYLLCEIDIDWVADGVRDRGHMRAEMQQLFRDAVQASSVPTVEIRGAREERRARAEQAVSELLASRRS